MWYEFFKYALYAWKALVSKGCNSHVILAGTMMGQMFHLAHANKTLGAVCKRTASKRRIGWRPSK